MGLRITLKNRSPKISVTTTPKNRIEINTGGGVSGGSNYDQLVKLKDVDATHVANNETLVYDENTGKFVIEEIPIINGGTF